MRLNIPLIRFNEVFKVLITCKLNEGESVCNHVQRMYKYVEHLRWLNLNADEELAIDIVLNSFPSFYDHFI